MSRTLKELLAGEDYYEKLKLNSYNNLLQCIKDVGGNAELIDCNIRNGMTVTELIDILAPNKITFSIIK